MQKINFTQTTKVKIPSKYWSKDKKIARYEASDEKDSGRVIKTIDKEKVTGVAYGDFPVKRHLLNPVITKKDLKRRLLALEKIIFGSCRRQGDKQLFFISSSKKEESAKL